MEQETLSLSEANKTEPELTFMPHQVSGIKWLNTFDRALLADEAGLGKSAQLLWSAREPALIVAPAMVIEGGTWDDEIEKWASGIDATQVSYSSIAQRGPKGTVPKDSNGFPLTPLKGEYRKHFRTVILDECHYIKGRKTSWANAILELDADLWRLATGTPIPNWAQEAFMLLRALFPAEAKAGKQFGSYWRWANEWFDVSDGRYGKEIGDLREDRTWDQFRQENWKGRMLRRLREDVLTDLPPLREQEWRTPMVEAQRKAYRDLKKDYVAFLDNNVEIDVWSEPGMLVKLAQIATGLEVVGGKGSGKLKALKAILEDRPSHKLVVAHFQNSVDACADAAREVGRSVAVVHGGTPKAARQRAIRAFQAGDVSVLCASIGTISEGLTLHQGGADEVIRVERSWSPYKNDQVARRLHRIGVERPVTLTDLITPGTVDERVLDVLASKTEQQIKALTATEIMALL